MKQPKRLGLALGGGGSRALCHLGVLSALETAGVRVDVVTGSSMGAIVGALYAECRDATRTRQRAQDYFQSSSLFGKARKHTKSDGLQARTGPVGYVLKYLRAAFISNVLSVRKSFLRTNPAFKAVRTLLPDTPIEALRLPFACTVLNLTQGRLETIDRGALHPAAMASTNIGVVFPPFRWGTDDYVDPAPLCAVPVHAARRLGAEVVLAVDIRADIPRPFPIQNGFDVISRIEMIESKTINDLETGGAEVVLRPDTGEVFWGDFSDLDPIIAAGEAAVSESLPTIRSIVGMES